LRHPEHAAVIQRVLSIPSTRFERRTVTFLTKPECEALIDAPDPKRWEGRRDRAMLTLTIQTGLRVSELIGVIALWLGHADIRSTQPYIHADMTIKERTLALVTPASVKPGRYKPADDVLTYLDSLG
jgi:site-specific recombinase XerD